MNTAALRSRSRTLGFVALSVVCVATATGYVLHSRARVRSLAQAAAALPTAAPASVAAVEAQPHVLFRNMTAAAQAGFAALAPLDAPDGPRQITGYACRRLYMAAGHGLCLAEVADDPFGAPYRARFFGPDFKTLHELPLAGLPSRARVSPDGTLGAATVFVNGDSYAGRHLLHPHHDLRHGARARRWATSRTFTVFEGRQTDPGGRLQLLGRDLRPPTTGRFYATLGDGRPTYLVQGDLAARTVKVAARRGGVPRPSRPTAPGSPSSSRRRAAGSPGRRGGSAC